MSDTQTIQIKQLEKLRTAWQPAVEFLFGEAVPEAHFSGFEIGEEVAKPVAVFDENTPYQYKIQIPARSFTNQVILLADVLQEMVKGLWPMEKDASRTNLCEGVAVFGAITGIKQVFGEESVDSYLNALKEQAFTYYDAFSYVAILLADDPQAIKKLRDIQPFLYKVEKADFDQAGLEVERKMRDILLLTFRG
ncbi:hypothetical protein [Marinomonas sp. TW1]|uniref:hypothetical protein n=1 Tax=Marinomonas sp. TW1 TaxID=1561203 RepID=UPI0007AF6A05|nr:hypothetical protein [Marinomonas sp. TW1]KZN12211.1 hypothetical protein OA79_17515 [Marinomonas sp. TW1]